MKIHTNLTPEEFRSLNAGLTTNFHGLSEHGSRSRARAFEVRLGGNGGRNNTGLYGAGDYCGATWDEWGAFFAALYELDPEALCGGSVRRPIYADADDFHFQTGDRFRNGLPADTHPKHRWEYQGVWGDRGHAGHACKVKGCSATMPSREAILERRKA